ncbi:MAG TPA: type II secretion system F family protein [Clostridiales bacterium]|nr:type II secretion system F family protein [Clostridiales bacterium]HOL91406.1 type II secretion system F family protein [Clostridiales bacterium]
MKEGDIVLDHFAVLYRENRIMFLLLGAINVVLGVLLSRGVSLYGSGRVTEAMGARKPAVSPYRRCSMLVEQSLVACGKLIEKRSIYQKARDKMKKAGYRGEYAPVAYIFVRYVVSAVIFLAALFTNYPDVIRPIAFVVLVNSIVSAVISANKRKVNLRFQKHIYKIYKYLHNQISSGVKPTDAVRTVYETTDDREIRDVLIRLAARYELTLDIDSALEELRSSFDTHEAETLCLALKQGIQTGDNKELLAKQEDIMFKKYFNYIQAETDSCRNRGVAAAAVFVAIIAVMIIVPMLDDLGQAVGRIFIN